MKGTVFSIEEFAVNDGPGIRTTVFLKGCPLRCAWCHNPEGLKAEPQIMHLRERDVVCGREIEASELAEMLKKDADFYAMNGGGVTFTGGGVRNIIVRNCDVCWIGGSTQYIDNNGSSVRYGNGIEFWGGARDILVENCRVWECWDAGLTNQSNVNGTVQQNIVYRNNEVWNCEYSYEYWQQGKDSRTGNITLQNNTFRNAGGGWSHSRRWNPNAAHLMMYDNTAATENFIIRRNTFSRSEDCILRLFNAWYPFISSVDNIWKRGKGIICRYHGRPTGNLQYRYPNHLDEIRDDNEKEIQGQTAESPDVFRKGGKELKRFLERFGFDR